MKNGMSIHNLIPSGRYFHCGNSIFGIHNYCTEIDIHEIECIAGTLRTQEAHTSAQRKEIHNL